MKKKLNRTSSFPSRILPGINVLLILALVSILPLSVNGKSTFAGSKLEMLEGSSKNVIIPTGYQQAILQAKEVKGIVKDASGLPMPGVNVFIKGSQQRGTITNENGEFSLQGVSEDEVLVISFIGMKSQEINVGNQTNIEVVLLPDNFEIEEMVVVAYGSKRKGAITGSVDVVDAEEFDQTPAASFDQALQGKAAGVHVAQTSGLPGAKAEIKIRGVGSIGNTSSEPLFVIDGIPTDAADFSELNPNDIESMSILKDASASSLYGSRAANGVILITTKRGKRGGAEFKFRTMTGFSNRTSDKFRMMNSQEFVDYEIMIGRYTESDPDAAKFRSVDYSWADNIFRTGKNSSYELSAAGGNEKTRFYTSLSYFKQDGIIKNSDIKRYNMRINLDHEVNDMINFGTNLTFGKSHRNTVTTSINGANPMIAAYMNRPYHPAYNPDGSYGDTHWSGFWNIFEMFENITQYADDYKAMGNVFIEISPMEGLTIRESLGLDLSQRETFYYRQPDARDVVRNGLPSIMTNTMYRNISTISTTTANYTKLFNEVHEVKGLLGFEVQESKYEGFKATGKTFPSDLVTTLHGAAEPSEVAGPNSDNTGWGLLSYFANFSYNYESKYMLDLSARRDGSSRFGVNNRYGNFWSVGAGWNVHEESFIKSTSFINRLKIRGSVGTSGNFDIGDFTHLDLYGFSGYNQKNVSYPYQISNPDLTWEKNFIISTGIDYSILNDRVSGTIDYYNRKTKDLLWEVLLSYTSGFASRTENVGSIRNSGVEFSVNVDVIDKKDFDYSIGASISANRNEVLELYEGDDIPSDGDMILSEGHPVNSFYLTKYAGVNPANGEALFYDKNGNVSSSNSGDLKQILEETADPDFFGNINNKISYKGFELSADIYYSVGNYVMNGILEVVNGDGGEGGNQMANALYDSWKKPGDITEIPKQSKDIPREPRSTRELENASFLRLKDITLSYNLPKSLVERAHLKGVRVYARGINLWTYTKFSGFDPESQYGPWVFSYPPARTMNFGVDITF